MNTFGPKLIGALNLVESLEQTAPDFVVFFSSISAIVGNDGQGNYVAANAFLDSYASALRARGIAATSIDWGVLSEAGVVARDHTLAQLLQSSGIAAYDNQQALEMLEFALLESRAQLGAFQVDWDKLGGASSSRLTSWLYDDVRHSSHQRARSPALERTLAVLLDLPAPEQLAYVEREFRQRFAQLLKMDLAAVELDQSLVQLGLDSLMALESARALERELGVEVTAMDFLGGASIAKLAREAHRQLASHLKAAEVACADSLVQLESQGEAELDRLLAELQAGSGTGVSHG